LFAQSTPFRQLAEKVGMGVGSQMRKNNQILPIINPFDFHPLGRGKKIEWIDYEYFNCLFYC
jgi:hypothetical protein